MDFIAEVAPVLLTGAGVSLSIGIQAGLGAIVISIVVGALRGLSNPVVRALTAIYVEFFRGTSAFVQVYWAYFVLPLLGVRLSALEAGIAVLALNVGAYGSEVVRGAINAVPKGQHEACHALGLAWWVAYWKVIVPQAMTRAIVPIGNLLVDLVKGTSLLSAITVTELAFAGRQAVQTFGHPLAIFAIVLVLYLAITAPIAWGARWLDERIRAKQFLGQQAGRV